MTTSQEPQATNAESAPNRDGFEFLVRAVRRLTIAVWCLIGLLVAVYAIPWLSFLWQVKKITTAERPIPAETETAPAELPYAGFDNQFHQRSPEEKIQRATVILLAQSRREEGKHKTVITEIIKRSPEVLSYYEVGEEFAMLSHPSSSSCDDCDGDGSVVFMVGNPAQMASSYSFRGGRIDGMGGLSIEKLRIMAAQPGGAAEKQ